MEDKSLLSKNWILKWIDGLHWRHSFEIGEQILRPKCSSLIVLFVFKKSMAKSLLNNVSLQRLVPMHPVSIKQRRVNEEWCEVISQFTMLGVVVFGCLVRVLLHSHACESLVVFLRAWWRNSLFTLAACCRREKSNGGFNGMSAVLVGLKCLS